MKSRNVILSLILALFVFAAGGAWWLYMSIDGLVKQAIENWGSQITGVAVKVDSVRIQAADGKGMIRGLVVGNPKGFEAKHSLKLGEISMTIDPASITRDVVVIRELVLVAPDVVYERGQGSDNLAIIQKNADTWVAANLGAQKKDAGPGKKLVIESLVIRNGRANFGPALSAAMPNIQLRDVGKKTNGAAAGDIVKQVWRATVGGVGGLAVNFGSAIKDGAAGAAQKIFK
jgi:hypothetical protein